MAERDAEDRAASELSAEINGLLIDYFARKIQCIIGVNEDKAKPNQHIYYN